MPDDLKLSNGGESLQLIAADGTTIQEFIYRDDWEASTDGQGYSLTIVDCASGSSRLELAIAVEGQPIHQRHPGRGRDD